MYHIHNNFNTSLVSDLNYSEYGSILIGFWKLSSYVHCCEVIMNELSFSWCFRPKVRTISHYNPVISSASIYLFIPFEFFVFLCLTFRGFERQPKRKNWMVGYFAQHIDCCCFLYLGINMIDLCIKSKKMKINGWDIRIRYLPHACDNLQLNQMNDKISISNNLH